MKFWPIQFSVRLIFNIFYALDRAKWVAFYDQPSSLHSSRRPRSLTGRPNSASVLLWLVDTVILTSAGFQKNFFNALQWWECKPSSLLLASPLLHYLLPGPGHTTDVTTPTSAGWDFLTWCTPSSWPPSGVEDLIHQSNLDPAGILASGKTGHLTRFSFCTSS